VTKVRWTPQAADDLQAIFDFIARDSPHYARLTVEGILGAIDHLERFPQLGRRVAESARDDLRELIKGPYRICLPNWRGNKNSNNRSRGASVPD
jgi:plasmid stabilization system protein ParE